MTTQLSFRSALLIALLVGSGTVAMSLPGYAQQVPGAAPPEVDVLPTSLHLVDVGQATTPSRKAIIFLRNNPLPRHGAPAHTPRTIPSSSLIGQCLDRAPAPGKVEHKRPLRAFYLSFAATAIPAGAGALLWTADPTVLEISGAVLFVAGTLIGPSLGLCYAEDYALRDLGLLIRGTTYAITGITAIVMVLFINSIFGSYGTRLDEIEFGLIPWVFPIGVSAAFDVLISPYAAHLYNERGGPRYSFDISLPDPLGDLIDGLAYGVGLSFKWRF